MWPYMPSRRGRVIFLLLGMESEYKDRESGLHCFKPLPTHNVIFSSSPLFFHFPVSFFSHVPFTDRMVEYNNTLDRTHRERIWPPAFIFCHHRTNPEQSEEGMPSCLPSCAQHSAHARESAQQQKNLIERTRRRAQQ